MAIEKLEVGTDKEKEDLKVQVQQQQEQMDLMQKAIDDLIFGGTL